MSGSAPSKALFGISTFGLILETGAFLFPICLSFVESLMLFPSFVLCSVLYMSVDSSTLVSATPHVF